MNCVNCGAQLNGTENVCPYCGQQINNSGVNQNNQMPNNQGMNNQNGSAPLGDKSKVCAGLLGIFLGTIGAHNFYLGFKGKAIAQLLISLLSCGLLCWVSSIWGFIEGIMILTGSSKFDAQGNLLRD